MVWYEEKKVKWAAKGAEQGRSAKGSENAKSREWGSSNASD